MSVQDLARAFSTAADDLLEAQELERKTAASLATAKAAVEQDEKKGPPPMGVWENMVKWAAPVAAHREAVPPAQAAYDAAAADLEAKTTARDSAWAALVNAS